MESPKLQAHQARARKNYGKSAIALIIIIIIIALAYYSLSQAGSVRPIGQNYTFSLQRGSAQNLALDNGKAFSIYLNYSTASAAYVYVSSIPIFQGQTTMIALPKGQAVNISINGSKYSDIELKAVSSNSTGAVLSVIQIPHGLKVSSGQGTVSTAITTAGATTSQTTVQTTTINSSILALAAFNSSGVGTLITNFGTLYRNTQSCTPSLYNSTFISTQKQSPSGPNTYYNVSRVTPYTMLYSANEVSPGTFNLTYTTVSKTSSSKVLEAQFSYPSNVLVSYSFTGIFNGMTYSQVLANYNSQNSIGNSCAALIP